MFVVDLKYSGVLGWKKSEFNELLHNTYRVGLEFWHKEFRDKRFTHAGAREYGFRPRKGDRGNPSMTKSGKRIPFKRSYTGQKLRKYGHTRPLELTGESRNNTRLRDVRTTSKGGRVILRAPRLNFHREEATAVSADEEKQITRVMNRYMDAQLRNERGIRKEVIRS